MLTEVRYHTISAPLNGRIYFLDLSRSEEHTSELQSRGHLVCRLLLEKKKAAQKETTPKDDHKKKQPRPQTPQPRKPPNAVPDTTPRDPALQLTQAARARTRQNNSTHG